MGRENHMKSSRHETTVSGMTSSALLPTVPSIMLASRKKAAAEDRSVRDYLFMLRRRWKLAAVATTILFMLSSAIILTLPRKYRADVLVLLQPPSVSTSNSVILQPDILKRLDALREQVESRRTLNQVIRKYDLFAASQGSVPEDEIFDMVRKSITLKLGKSSFNLYFDHEDPQTAADVANELARHYIEESMRLRRDSLNNTSAFISTQLKRLEREVKDIELVLQEFRKQNMGAMPEDVPANQALLMALSSQVSQTEGNLDNERLRKRKAEDRVTELLVKEISTRQRLIRSLAQSLKRFPIQDDAADESRTPRTAAQPRAAPPAPARDEGEQKRMQERLLEIEVALGRLKAAAQPGAPPAPNQETVRLKEEQARIKDDLERLSRAEPRAPAPILVSHADAGEPVEPPPGDAGDDVEMEVLREGLRVREAAVADAERNADDLEGLLKRGMVSEIVVKKARGELERARGDLRIHRTQALRTRNKMTEQLRTNESELAALKDFQAHWNEMLVKIQEIEAQRLRISSGSSEEAIRGVNTRVETLTGELAAMRARQAELSSSLMAARGDLAQQVQEHENIMSSLVRQQTDIMAIKTRVADLDRRLTNSARVQVQLPELMRKYRTVTDQYESMLRSKMQADMAMGVEDQQEGERMVIWDPAIKQSSPYRPKYMLLFGGSFLFALGAGVALGLLLELTSPKYLTPDNLHTHTGLDVLARFGELTAADVPDRLPENIPPSAARIITLSDPWHRVSKQFLDCSSLLFKPAERWPRVVAVCSPGNGDGKTFVAANLAAAMAMSYKEPTLLVDANLRAPELHKIFGKTLENGLAEALEGAPIRVHPVPGAVPCDLQLLTAGYTQKHASVLLGSVRFREMMEKLSCNGVLPRMVLDTPPLQAGADVDVLLDAVDGVLLVVRPGHTPMSEVTRALRRIPQDKLLGVIFNAHVTA